MKNKKALACFQCGSELIAGQPVIDYPSNAQSATTRTSYTCSNESCQTRIDKKLHDMQNQRAAREKLEVVKAQKLAESREKAREAKKLLLGESAK